MNPAAFPQHQQQSTIPLVTYQTVMVPVHGGMPPTAAATGPAPAGYYVVQPGPGVPALPAPQGPPSQGPGDQFAHIRHIPMFPLNAASDRPEHNYRVTRGAYQVTRVMKFHKSVITRWACNLPPPPPGPNNIPTGTIIIDIYQLRNPFSMGRSPFRLHVNRDVQLRVAGRFDVAARRGKVWSKHFTKQQHIDEVVILLDGGMVAIPAVMVERREEPVAPEESEEVKMRFARWVIQA
ncbi:hypothetical protein V8F06_010479 [Rhypophila decipiens]